MRHVSIKLYYSASVDFESRGETMEERMLLRGTSLVVD